MSFRIEYATAKRLMSFYQLLDKVAQERIYLQMTEAPPFERMQAFQTRHIKNNWPNFFAVTDNEVIGWIEITPKLNLCLAHRGLLSMGVSKLHRGMGIGKELLNVALEYAKKIGLEKVELDVYESNKVAIELYKKFGFKQSGFISHYRKLDGEYYDCLFMDLSLV